MCGKLGNFIKDSTEGDDNGVLEEKLSTPGVHIAFISLHYADSTYQWPRLLGVRNFRQHFCRDLYHGWVFARWYLNL